MLCVSYFLDFIHHVNFFFGGGGSFIYCFPCVILSWYAFLAKAQLLSSQRSQLSVRSKGTFLLCSIWSRFCPSQWRKRLVHEAKQTIIKWLAHHKEDTVKSSEATSQNLTRGIDRKTCQKTQSGAVSDWNKLKAQRFNLTEKFMITQVSRRWPKVHLDEQVVRCSFFCFSEIRSSSVDRNTSYHLCRRFRWTREDDRYKVMILSVVSRLLFPCTYLVIVFMNLRHLCICGGQGKFVGPEAAELYFCFLACLVLRLLCCCRIKTYKPDTYVTNTPNKFVQLLSLQLHACT